MSKLDIAAQHYALGEQMARTIQKDTGMDFGDVVDEIDRRKEFY